MDQVLQTLRTVLARQWSNRCAALRRRSVVSRTFSTVEAEQAYLQGRLDGFREGYWDGAVDILTSDVVQLQEIPVPLMPLHPTGDEVGPH